MPKSLTTMERHLLDWIMELERQARARDAARIKEISSLKASVEDLIVQLGALSAH